MSIEVDDGTSDHESLFGDSPPAGRSPSPVGLALPSAQNAVMMLSDHNQNVGTIALTGSPNVSELSNPLAFSSSVSLSDSVPRHPQVPPPSNPGRKESNQQSRPRTQDPSRTSQKRKDQGRTNKEPFVPPPPPPIPMPDPSRPVPANYFRTQSRLLGIAGMVSQVDPSRLHSSSQQGSTMTHPIDVDNSFSQTSYVPPPPPSPPPPIPIPMNTIPASPLALSSTQIMANLMGGRNVPLLKSMVQYLIHQAQPPQGFRRTFQRRNALGPELQPQRMQNQQHPPRPPSPKSRSPSPPPKKRKRIPAGAADWDVPYPFAEGEAPEGYKETWQRDRARKLLSQVAGLFKDAADAASQKVQQDQLRMQRIRREHLARLHQATHPNEPLPPHLAPPVQQDAHPVSEEPLPTPMSADAHESSEDAVGELLLSLLQCQPAERLSDVSNGQTPELPSSAEWNNFFNDLPGSDLENSAFTHMSFDEMMNQLTGSNLSNLKDAPTSLSSPDPLGADLSQTFPMDSSSAQFFDTNVAPPLFPTNPPTLTEQSNSRQGMPQIDTIMSSVTGVADTDIDPFLLALSTQPPTTQVFDPWAISATPSLVQSPATGATSVFATPDPETPFTNQSHLDSFPLPEQDTATGSGWGSQAINHPTPQSSKAKGKEAEIGSQPTMAVNPYTPTHSSAGTSPFANVRLPSRAGPFLNLDLPSLLPPSTAIPVPRAKAKAKASDDRPRPSIHKNEILRRAQEKREKLVQEVQRANMELRDLTVKHAVLSRLAQSYSWTGDGA